MKHFHFIIIGASLQKRCRKEGYKLKFCKQILNSWIFVLFCLGQISKYMTALNIWNMQNQLQAYGSLCFQCWVPPHVQFNLNPKLAKLATSASISHTAKMLFFFLCILELSTIDLSCLILIRFESMSQWSFLG